MHHIVQARETPGSKRGRHMTCSLESAQANFIVPISLMDDDDDDGTAPCDKVFRKTTRSQMIIAKCWQALKGYGFLLVSCHSTTSYTFRLILGGEHDATATICYACNGDDVVDDDITSIATGNPTNHTRCAKMSKAMQSEKAERDNRMRAI
jgi:hypothetical protein